MLFHALMGDTGAAYVEQISLDCRGDIDVELLRQSFNALLERYDILRTVFQYQDLKHPLQIVLRRRAMKIHFQDVTELDPTAQETFLEDYKASVRRKGFDLSRDLLLKIALFKTGPEAYTLVWSSHHIVMDGWCLGILFKDLLAIYSALQKGAPHNLPPVTPYKKYIQWLDNQKPGEAGAFWKDYLAGYGQKTGFLPEDSESDNEDYNLREHLWQASEGLSRGLEEIAAELQVTVNTIFQATWGILLHNYNFCSDAVFGSVVSGRPPGIPGIETMVGLFVNTVPTRVQTHEGQTFEQLAQALHRLTSAAKPYEFVPLAETQALTPLRENLFDHLVSFQNFPIQDEIQQSGSDSGPGFSIIRVHVHEQTHYSLNALVGFAGNLTVNFNYNARLYPDAAIQSMAAGLERLLIQVTDNCRQPVQELAIIDRGEKKRLLETLDNHAPDFPSNRTISEIFAGIAARYAEQPALLKGFDSETSPERVTYRELEERASRVAAFLQNKGVGPDSIVALRFQRSYEMLMGIFGVLLAGGAYMPIDPAFPNQRALYMLNDSNTRLLLGGDDLDHDELGAPGQTEIIPFSEAAGGGGHGDVRPTGLTPRHLAYVIYTSGTTGRPKGSLLQQDNVVSLLFHKPFPFDFSHHDVWTLFHSYGFDFSVWEIFGALLTGGSLLVISTEIARDPGRFLDLLGQNQVTILNQTPSSFYNISAHSLEYEDLKLHLRYVIFGGEALKMSRLEDWRRRFPRVHFINMYGITETTVHVTFKEIQDADIQADGKSIGAPLDTLQVLIGGRDSNLLPAGVPGEILVAGAGVCRGYLNRPELTAEKFTGSPRVYRSGDKGRLTATGELEYYGRIDAQVKIRGYRIEPQEIEEALRRHPAVDDALVRVVSGDDHDRRLCAYVIPGGDLESLRSFAAENLPSYMIPSYFVPLAAFPLTSNGKLDTAALPAPLEHAPEPVTEPTGPVEKKLAQVWSQVLVIEPKKIGNTSDFFQLGGHSLKVTRLAALIHKEFGVKIPLPQLFNRSTIAGQAEIIAGKDGRETFQAIEPVEKQDYYVLSPNQKRFYFLQQLDRDSIAYNIPQILPLSGVLARDKQRLLEVMGQLIQRHEALRTSFTEVLHQPVQRIHETVDFQLETIIGDQTSAEHMVRDFIRPFNLSRAPLMRVAFLEIPGRESRLILDIHHIIADGTSMKVLIRDFLALLDGDTLAPLNIHYKDVSVWQEAQARAGVMREHEDFWRRRLNGPLPVLEFPTDFPRPAQRSHAGQLLQFEVGSELFQALGQLKKESGATLYMILLAALNVLLFRYARQEDIIVGSPIAARHHADLESIIGLMIGSVMMRNAPAGDLPFSTFLRQVKANTLEAFQHQAYPFEEILERIDYPDLPGRNPISDVGLIVQNMFDPTASGGDNGAGDAALIPKTSKLDFTLIAVEQEDDLSFILEYSTELFLPETMERLSRHFLNILARAAHTPSATLDAIDILDEGEKIDKVGEAVTCYPLSLPQQRVLDTERVYAGTSVNTLAFTVEYDEILPPELVEEAVNHVLRHNDGLRLRPLVCDVQTSQYAAPHRDVELDIWDFDGDAGELSSRISRDSQIPFDIERQPLCYFAYIKYCSKRSGYYVKFHHLVGDGWTAAMLFQQIDECLMELKDGRRPIERESRSYIHFISQEAEYVQSAQYKADREYWLQKTTPLPQRLDLAAGQSPPGLDDIRSHVLVMAVDPPLRQRIVDCCRRRNTTLFKLFLAALTTVVGRVTGTDDVLVGSPGHNRGAPEQKETMGMFVSTNLLRLTLNRDMTAGDLLNRVHRELAAVVKIHQRFPFQHLQKELLRRDNLPIDHLLDIHLVGHGSLSHTNYRTRHHFAGYDPSPLSIHINDRDVLDLEWMFRPGLYPEDQIQALHNAVMSVADGLAADGDPLLRDIPLLPEQAMRDVCRRWNREEEPMDHWNGGSMMKALEQSLKTNKDRIGVTAGNGQVSYGYLDARASGLAERLRPEEVGPGSIAAVMMEPSLDMIAALLGILKAGAAYLPLSPQAPAQRVSFMLRDSAARLLLIDNSVSSSRAESLNCPVLPVDAGESLDVEQRGFHQGRPSDPVYIIYTSGSTGRPKGVVTSHANLEAYLNAFFHQFTLNAADVVIQQAAFTFDAFVEEFYPALLTGARLVVPGRDVVSDAETLSGFLAKHHVSFITCSPLLLNELNHIAANGGGDRLRAMRIFISGGDVLRKRYVSELMNIGEVFNTYGPTETTVCATYQRCSPDMDERVPIGSAIQNYNVAIMDPQSNVLPAGLPGEICIGGPGLAHGYLNRPRLTAEKFVCRTIRGCGEISFYRSGDRGVMDGDGVVRFLGRIDRQVKIRGYRIELAEIEYRLLQHPKVRDAALTVHELNGAQSLCAYLVGDLGGDADLRDYLERSLPSYMIPGLFLPVDAIPRTAGGKVDRKRLPKPETLMNRVVSPPRNDVEAAMLDIWAGLLGADPHTIGIDTNFFEAGGHSLKATRMVHRLNNRFDAAVELRDIFSYPTIRQLAERVQAADTATGAAIVNVEKMDVYDLSYAQRRLWILCQFEEDSTAYNMPGAFFFMGDLKIEAFREAVKNLAARHESLRTTFVLQNGIPKQRIIEAGDFPPPVEVVDLRHLQGNEPEAEGRRMYVETANSAFDLETGPLFLFKLLRLDDETYLVIFNIHHIVNDGWSQGIINRDLAYFYNRELGSGAEEELSTPLPLQYKDYAAWHNSMIQDRQFDSCGRYWLEKLKDKPTGLELPVDFPRPPIQTFNGKRLVRIIDARQTAALENICAQNGATLFMGLMNLLSIFLHKYTGSDDILIGAPIAGRSREELQPLVGFLVNTLVYRFAVNGDASFIQSLDAVRRETLECYRYQDYPFDLLVEELGLERDLSSSPLFNVMLAHNNTIDETQGLSMEGVSVDGYPHTGDVNISKFDLIFFLDELEEQIFLTLEYNTDLFREETISRMADNFITLVCSVLDDPGKPARQLVLLHPDERRMVVREFNGDRREFPELTVPQLFVRQAEATPLRVAVVYDREGEKERVTYGELLRRARRLAHHLVQRRGVGPGSIVGVSLDRSVDMVAALWGIMLSGAGYVAIDPNYPPERVAHILKDSDTRLIVADNSKPHLLERYSGDIIYLPGAWETMAVAPDDFQPPPNRMEDILYVIYTSGSTGTPNGAMLSHGLLSNLTQWQHQSSGIDRDVRCLQFTSVNFCVSFQEIAVTLTGGGQVHLIGDVERQDIDYLMDVLEQQRIESLYLPFSYLNFLFNQSDKVDKGFRHSLKHIVTAGEQLKITSGLKNFLDTNPSLRLHNHYGSSEMHVVSSYSLDGANAAETPVPPAGKPVDNTDIFILDDDRNPVPIGVWGELCIAGSHEVLGYINNRELTDKKLLRHPQLSRNGKRLYQSGDLGRWLPDGNIEIKGRKDLQVKIRGFRIELGEVESRILAIDGVKECVVVVKDLNSGGSEYGGSVKKELLGYVVLEGIDVEYIKRIMASQVPKYMIPLFVRMEALPLMPNGKVDRDRLPEPDLSELEDVVAPTDPLEHSLVEIWSEILKLPPSKIGTKSDFFQLGGHSLNATIMVSHIHRQLNVRIPLTEVFKAPTVAELAGLVKSAQTATFTPAEAVEKRDYYPCSSAQRRLLFLQYMEPDTVGYNIPSAMIVEGPLDLKLVERCFGDLVRRHESFRTSFLLKDGTEPVQRIHDDAPFRLEIIAGDDGVDDPEELIRQFVRPFPLTAPPLLRVGVVEMGENRYLLITDMHHLIADGVSMSIFVREFTALYAGVTFADLPLQYKDYSLWQSCEGVQAELLSQKNFWRMQFADRVPVLDLPLDFPRPRMQSFDGGNVVFQAPAKVTDKLLSIASTRQATPYMAFLSVFYILLSKLSGQEDIVVGTPVSGRVHAEFDPVIGMFVNTLPLRNEPVGDGTFAQFLDQVRDTTIAAFDNQQFPFEEMVECLDIQRDTSRNPLFDVVFSLQNFNGNDRDLPPEGLAAGDFSISPLPFKGTVSKFDLTLTTRLMDDGVAFNVEYCTALFEEETISRFAGYFLGIMEVVAQNPDVPLDEIDIMPQEEREQMVDICNAPVAPFPQHETLHSLFCRRAEERPEAAAVTVPDDEALSYGELDARSSRLASELRLKGVTADIIVAVLMDRSPLMIVAILGILKAGGAYMPIDPDYPPERAAYMLADSAAPLLVTREDLPQQRALDIDKIFVRQLDSPCDSQPFAMEEVESRSLAYVIYTSGTTGRPKGSLIQHHNVVSLMFHQPYPFELSHHDVWTLFHSYCFDFSVWEMYGALLYGGRLVMVDAGAARDPGLFLEILERERVTVLNQTPSSFYNVSAQSGQRQELDLKLRYVIFGGEALKPSRLEYWRNRFGDIRFVNMYGITETTVHVTFKEIDDEDIRLNSPSIGAPLSTLNVMVAGRNLRPVPQGVPGEILVSGAGVCRGYLNRPELTAEKFIEEGRVYRSGDRGRLTSAGELDYMGRIDQQVKIRGFRIEPKEIEAVLRRHPRVEDTLVLAIENGDGERSLCAYVIPGDDLNAIREFMEGNLPSYMVPSYFVPLQVFPLTPNGKLDLDGLPAPLTGLDSRSGALEDPVEEALAGIFAGILDIDVSTIGRDNSFFELGGHSLKAVSLANEIHRQLQVKLPIHAIFQSSTVAQLALEIKNRERTTLAAIEPLEPRDHYELSYTQKRMWVLQSRDPESAAFNMPEQMAFDRPLDVELVKRAFQLLAARHEALRTCLKQVEGRVMQEVLPEVEIPLEYLDLSQMPPDDLKRRLEEIWTFESENGFDLYEAPLLRVKVIRLGDEDWYIMFNIHHILSDGWSMEVLKGDFQAIYQSLETGQEPSLETVEIQYKDYAHWHNRLLEDEEKLLEALSFWREHLSGTLPVLNLPYDSSPNQLTSRAGAAYRMVLTEEVTEKLNRLARDRNCSYYMVMLAAVNLLLSQLRQQDDILFGLPGAAREHPGLRRTVGLFVNTLVLRTRLNRDVSFLELLGQVKADTMKVLEYQGFPMELIVDQLAIDYPKFSMFFNMLNMADNSEVLPDHRSFHLTEVQDAKFDLEFYIKEYQNGTVILCSYFRQLFLPDTIEKITTRLAAILQQIAADATLPLKEYRGAKKKGKILKKRPLR
jgi:amino acid adenylation domain-containing protein